MRKLTISEKIRDSKIQQLEAEVKRLKEIIAWQSYTMAGIDPKTKKLTAHKK